MNEEITVTTGAIITIAGRRATPAQVPFIRADIKAANTLLTRMLRSAASGGESEVASIETGLVVDS